MAVVGAGIAGLALARTLGEAGRPCILFDKGRAPGGRLATRRAALPDGTALAFDHGCAFLTAPGEGGPLRDLLAPVLAAGALAPWSSGLVDLRPTIRLAGAPGMSALPRALAAGFDLRLGAPVTAIRQDADGWHLQAGDAPAGPFAALALALPAPQAVALLEGAALDAPGGDAPQRFAAALRAARYAPCWTLMAAFAAPLPLPDALRPGAGPIAFAAREGAKPGRRREGPDLWVAHAAAGWSRERLEDEPEAVRRALLDALGAHVGGGQEPLHAATHRWRYALVERAAGNAPLWDAALALGACGDHLAGPRAGQAALSGRALAGLIAGASG